MQGKRKDKFDLRINNRPSPIILSLQGARKQLSVEPRRHPDLSGPITDIPLAPAIYYCIAGVRGGTASS